MRRRARSLAAVDGPARVRYAGAMRARAIFRLAFILCLAVAVAALGAVACSSTTPPGASDAAVADVANADVADGGDPQDAPVPTCPSDLPDACPSPTPSFQSTVLPIFQDRCWACHADGGVEATRHDLGTYGTIFAQRGPVLTQVYGCVMPPPLQAPELSAAQRAALLGWLVCGAPDN